MLKRRVARRVRQRVGGALVLAQQPDLGRVAAKDLLDHRQIGIERRVLRQVGHAQIARHAHAPAIGGLGPGDDPQQRGFAAAVHAHHAHALAGIDAQRHAVEQRPVGELFVNCFER